MGRCTVMRWAFVAGLLCFCGCTGPRTFSPFGWMHGSDSSQASSTTDKSNPLKPTDQTASDNDSASNAAGSKLSDDAASADGKSADRPGKNGFKTAAIDPELRKLMEEELAYEPADERQRLFNQWAKFDPAFIRELVENHRMARETAENRKHPVSLASAESAQDREGQAPDLDVQSPAKSANRPAAPSEPTIPNQPAPNQPAPNPTVPNPTAPNPTAPGAAAPVSPWSESSDMPALPTSPPASTATSPATGTSAAGPVQSSADAFNSPGDPGQPGRPISIVPLALPTAAARNNLAQNDALAKADTIPPSSETPATPNAVQSPAKTDAFAGMMPLDDGTTPAHLSTAPAAPTPGPAAASTAPSGNPAATSSDGLLIQPGIAAPASLISSLQAQAKGTPSGRASADLDVAPTAPSLDAPDAVRPAGQPANSTNLADSAQPVQLQPPTDVPSSSAVALATTAETKTASAAEASTSPASASASTPPSGLAGLGNRLFGAISPNLVAAARTAAQSGTWHDELQKIVAVAATEAGQTSAGTTDAEKLKYVEKQVHLRMLYLLAGQPAKSLEPISGLDAPDQEFWQQVFWGVSNYFDKTAMADPSDRATQTVTQLRTAVQRLQEKSKLELRNVAFCQKIVNYGNYERVKRDEFTAGQPVLLYAEVENFKSEPTTDGPYRTILKSSIEIFDSHGQSVQSMPFPPTDDLCASPRRDYYNSYEFAIPQRIGAGPHTLKLTVEDQVSRKVATYTVNFTVK